MTSGAHGLLGHVEAGFCAQLSPERLVTELCRAIAEACGPAGAEVKPARPLGDSALLAPVPFAAPEHAILGSLVDLSSRAEPPPPWRRWANPCHWSCQRCTERLAWLLAGHALTVLHGLAGEAPRPRLVTLTISPPPGIKLSELRHAVEEVDSANGGHAIWGLKIQDKGRAIAYMLTTTSDPKRLERQSRDSVRGDSRSAWFSRVRGSELTWAPPAEAFAFHVGRVVRHLTLRCPPPPTLHPGYRFGASGRFASILANALAALRREHPCQGVRRQRTQERGGILTRGLGRGFAGLSVVRPCGFGEGLAAPALLNTTMARQVCLAVGAVPRGLRRVPVPGRCHGPRRHARARGDAASLPRIRWQRCRPAQGFSRSDHSAKGERTTGSTGTYCPPNERLGNRPWMTISMSRTAQMNPPAARISWSCRQKTRTLPPGGRSLCTRRAGSAGNWRACTGTRGPVLSRHRTQPGWATFWTCCGSVLKPANWNADCKPWN